ncbi:MAG TPA: hypothetical protein VH796_04305 [Nitrososphaeraceae archaeon]
MSILNKSAYVLMLTITTASLAVILFLASATTFNSFLPNAFALSVSNGTAAGNEMPTAQSVFDTGTMSLPSSVKGFLVYIPDEAHHPLSDDKTISLKNANYIPTHLVVPKGTGIAFVHGDPGHVHIELVKDNKTNQVVWQTTPIKHPGGSDTKVLDPGSYSVSDDKYDPMKGSIKVDGNVQATGDLTVGGIFVPTNSLAKYKSDFTSAGFQVFSTNNFVSKTSQKDISGPNTLIIYSTHMPIDKAVTNIKPIIESLPYR